MKIRNVPYKDLNERERKVIDDFYKERLKDDALSCSNQPTCNKDVDIFWEAHREEDTEDGQYDGWKE